MKKLVPKNRRDKIVAKAERFLPENSLRRRHFANAISVGGVTLVAVGGELDRRGYKEVGAALRTVGHGVDDVDGDSARRLETDGRSGAIVDGTGDKIKIEEELRVLWRHTNDMDPKEALKRRLLLSGIAAKHIANAAIVMGIEQTGTEAHSSAAGQLNMWVDGVTFVAMNVSDLAPSAAVRAAANRTVDGLFKLGMVTGGVATIGYANELRIARRNADLT